MAPFLLSGSTESTLRGSNIFPIRCSTSVKEFLRMAYRRLEQRSIERLEFLKVLQVESNMISKT